MTCLPIDDLGVTDEVVDEADWAHRNFHICQGSRAVNDNVVLLQYSHQRFSLFDIIPFWRARACTPAAGGRHSNPCPASS